jgi:hypothetical protein
MKTKANMVLDGWTFSTSGTAAVGSFPNSRSGNSFAQLPTITHWIQTPVISNLTQFQFYYRSSSATLNTNFKVECSTDNTFATGVTLLGNYTTVGTAYQGATITGLGGYSNIYIRITSVSYVTTAAAVFLDDVSYISASGNNKIVSELGATTSCNAVTVPSATSLSYYDQGGIADTYSRSQNQTVYFAPQNASDKVKFLVNAFNIDATSLITVYNGIGTGGAVLLTGTGTSIAAGTTVTSSDASGYLTVVFASGTGTPPNGGGFDITVSCTGTPSVASVSPTNGCLGSSFAITGSNLSGATAVAIGGVPATFTVNSSTSITVTPGAATTSGEVVVTTPSGTTTAGPTYTINVSPSFTANPSALSQTACLNGSSTALNVTANAGGGTIGSYDWYSNTSATTVGASLVSSTNTSSTTNSFSPVTTATGTLYYYAVVSNTNGCSATSSFSGDIAVNAPVSITTSPSTTNQTFCAGDVIPAFSVTATGGGLSYQWYSNTSNSNAGGSPIAGETNSTFTPSNASAISATYYYCVVSNGAPCSSSVASSVSGSVTINGLPTAVIVSGAGSFCQPATLTASNGGSGTIYWQDQTSNGTSTATPSTSQIVTAASGTRTYYFRAQSAEGCWSQQGSATVVFSFASGVPTATAATLITTTGFNANWTAGAFAATYYLDVATDSGFTSIVAGYNNLNVGNVLTYAVSGLITGTTYYYRVRSGRSFCLPSANSSTISCTTLSLPYCIPDAPATSTSYVNNFSTSLGITNISNLGTGFTVGGYYNYASTNSCSQYPSSSLGYSITSVRSDSTDQTFFYYIWVDWNNDADFADAGETLLATTTYQPGPFTGTFVIPAGQAAGNYRMRVSTSWVGANTSCAINATGRGEMEDYNLTVVPVPPCAPSTPSALTSSSVNATGAVISWTDAAMTPNSIYNYYVSTSSVAPAVGATPTGTVTGLNSVSLTGLTLGNTYYFWVRSNCGTPSAWVGSSNFTTINQDIVNMTNGSSTTCNALFYDSGGSGASYLNNESYTYTFYPATPGSKLKVVFNSFNTENNYDGLQIFNGNSTAAPQITSALGAGFNVTTAPAGSYYGTSTPGTFYSTATDGSITFKFLSDFSVVNPGWSASITCVTVPIITSFTPNNVCVGGTPSVTITGSNFVGITSVKFNGVTAVYTVNSPTSITATLPASATTGAITVSNAQATGTSTTLFYVNPIPNTPSAGANTSICSGNSTTLNGVSSSTSSTTVLSQDFNTGAWPLGWNRTINGSFAPGDFRTSSEATSTGNTWTGNGYTGFCSYFYSYLISTGIGGDMETPTMDLSSYNAAVLTFWIYNSSGTDLLKVYANNNNGAYTQVGTNYGVYGAWTQITVSLNAYTGAGFTSVRLKFSGTSDATASNIGVDDIVVTGTSNSTYVWTPSTGLSSASILNPVANPTTATTYTLTTSYASGCSASGSVLITVNPKPTVTLSAVNTNVCANSVVPITAGGTSTTFTWTSTVANSLFTDVNGSIAYVPGSNAATIYVKTPSTATITATGSNGVCSDTASVTFTVLTKTFSAGLWSPAGPPTGSENLVINSNWTFGSLTGCSCTVNSGNVVFNSGQTLTLTNGLTVVGGSVTFNDGASLIQTNNVANTGNITYIRNSQPSYLYDYSYWASPVASTTLGTVSPITSWDGFYAYNPSITNWQLMASTSTMTPGIGYIIRVPDVGFNVSPGLPTVHTLNFVGVPNNGVYTTPISGGANQLNLIGNPYPSAISAASLVTDAANSSILDATLYFWTHNTPVTGGIYTSNDYAVWNLLGGVGTHPATNPGLNNSTPSGNIASGQGFFVKGLSMGNATFKNSMRLAANNTQFFRSSTALNNSNTNSEAHRIWLDVLNNDAQSFKQLLIGYVDGATAGIDRGYDSEMLDVGNVVSIYSLAVDKKLTIQGLGLPFVDTDIIPLGFKSTVDGIQTISLAQFDGLFENQGIYLEDKLLNVVQDLKQANYTFASVAGTFENRFVLRFTNMTLANPTFDEGSIVVYKNTDGIHINTGLVTMKNVEIYDVTGRLLASQTAINSAQTLFTNVTDANQILLVKITSQEGVTVTKKILN